ncbi:MAG: penicillin-binding transpeptidase domain-containing protein [Acidimicrobiia bacterium]
MRKRAGEVPGEGGSRSGSLRSGIVALILGSLVLIVLLVFWLAVGGEEGLKDEAQAPVQEPQPPEEAVRSRAATYFSYDWIAIDRALADVPFGIVPRYARWVRDLDVTGAAFSSGAIRIDDSRASVSFTVTLNLRGLGEWTYPGELRLAEEEGQWSVDWSPTIIHPSLEDGQWLRRTQAWPERAPILGHDGTLLATMREVVVVGVEPRRIVDLDEVLAAFEEHTGVDPDRVVAQLERPGVQPDWFLPVIELRPERYEELEPALRPVPGIVFRASTARLSPATGFASHVLGRVGEVTAELLEAFGEPYGQGDIVGLSGLERVFERQLAGRPYGEVQRVDAEGRVLEVLHRFEATEPQPVRTTIDLEIQEAADRALEGLDLTAAIVAVDVSSGEIRAVASRPFTEFNRALGGLYPPGSTFKIITTAALLEQGLEPSDVVPCPGEVVIGGKAFRNAGSVALGEITFRRAFADSCNTAFAHLASTLQPSDLVGAAAAFGFGNTYELPLRTGDGRFPDPQDLAEQAAAAIGQGRVLVSPLHMATVAAAVAEGAWRAPRLVASDPETEARPLNPPVVETLRLLMRLVVTEGTGTAAEVDGEPVHGKTGTAEFGETDPPSAHAWFVGFQGELAFAVLVEEGGSGGRISAPIARRFLAALSEKASAEAPE